MALHRICIIIPYFGSWPFWMPLFLESCRYNPTIDWLFYTDCGDFSNCSSPLPNVKVVNISFNYYCKLISARLGINFSPESPYKLCDVKPMLGHVHQDAISGYDFWGFGDIDLVYGNLREYFTPARLKEKDLFSTHSRRVSGHLCLIRNTEDMRTAFSRVKCWQAMLLTQEHLAFDEKAYSKIFLRHKNSPAAFRWIASRMDSWLQRAEFCEAYTTPNARIKWKDGTDYYPEEWYWKAGSLTNNLDSDSQFPYFHFMVWKKKWPRSAMTPMLDLGHMQNGAVFTERGITVV